MTSTEFIAHWVEVFNSANADELANLYHEDATNHQMTKDIVIGKNAIHQMFKEEFATAEMVCIAANIIDAGDWAILEWEDPLGLKGCGIFHIVNGKIKTQRGYWDKLTFLRQHNIAPPQQ